MSPSNLRGFRVPMLKTWGRKRSLRCMDLHEDRGASASAAVWEVGLDPLPVSTTLPSPPPPPLDDGFERMRMKLMAHIRDAADKLNLAVPRRREEADGDDVPIAKTESFPPRRRQRSANPRRRPPSISPPPAPRARTRSSRARSAALAEKEQRRERRLSVSLSREEIEEDLYALTGRRASGRPKRRPRALRKHLDLLFPGLGLTEITAGCYET